jgi:hypothetical protein
MEQRIIFKNDEGGVSVIIPSPDCGLTVEQIALKDVPDGKPFKIIDETDLPPRETRPGWEVEDSFLDDGIGDTETYLASLPAEVEPTEVEGE